ncbi:MAG: zinc ribbon domain-containing protein [Deltaproteobacteria bacterium]|jgi:hypothetical protein|nr:zinc ribbon domain-containing protein [Deltaproteobacteria bacterium]
MATDVVLEPAERAIERVRATYYISRMLAQSGLLHLTSLRLMFVPTGTIDRVVGAERVSLAIDEIQRLSCEGLATKKLTVRSAIKTYRFVGRNFENLERELRALVSRSSQSEISHREEVLAEARVNLFVSRLLTQSGLLHVTNRRVSFTPIGVLDRAMGARDLQLPVEAIEGIETSGSLDRRTRIRARNAQLLILGELPEAFVATLRRALAAKGLLLSVTEAPRSGHGSHPLAHCTSCTRPIDPAVGFCPHCGTPLPA